jgi:hypothetical protein
VRIELGIVGATVLLAVAGQGVLLALGITQLRVRSLLASAGLAYVAGVASTLLLGILLVAVGGELTIPIFTVLALLLGGGGVALAVRRGARTVEEERPGPRMSRAEMAAIGLGGALLVAFLVIGLADAGVRQLVDWDSWSIWTRKAIVLTNGGLDARVFAGTPYEFSHLEYPILQPLFESVYFRAMGLADTQAVHAVLWILFTASLGSIAYLGSRITRIWVWFPVVLAVAFGAEFHGQLLTAYADVPMGLLAASGVLCVGLWLREPRDWRWLALGALVLAAAANVKNEGLLLGVAVFLAAAIVLVVGREWRALGRLGLGFLGAAVAIAPWRIWTAAHHITSSLPIAQGLDPSYLSSRSDRVGPTLKALMPLLENSGLVYVVPLGLAVAVLGVFTAGIRRVAAFYLLAGLGTLASVVWAFVITADPLDWQIGTSANRVIMGVAFVAVAALVNVGGLLDSRRPRPEPGLEPAPGERAAVNGAAEGDLPDPVVSGEPSRA